MTGAASSRAKPTPSTSIPCTSNDSTNVAPRRSLSPIRGGCGATAADIGPGSTGRVRRMSFLHRGKLCLDRIEQHPGDVQSELRVQLADTGRTGDVDLGQVVADHVEPDEDHAAPLHFRTDLRRDPAIALGQWLADALAAGGQVAAELVALRDPRQAGIH